ncbi:MAG: hypothetical protein Q9162_001977 [Coniocarpon cinnabarinum]
MATTMTITSGVQCDTDQDIESDYAHHPSELVLDAKPNAHYTSQDLKNAIPSYCFQPSYVKSLQYLLRDFFVAGALMYLAHNYIDLINDARARAAAWAVYGYFQGQQMTGIWVLGHECGHGSFAPNELFNDFMGWVLHSILLTPYFSWQSTHRRHHIYANNLIKDHNYVPPVKSKYASLLGVTLEDVEEMTEDSPIVTVGRILLQQFLGWPWYLFANITSTQGSLAVGKTKNPPSKWPLGNSHFNPTSTLFRPEEWHLILASDIGIGLMMAALWYASTLVGWSSVALLYIQPYLWVNHWIVAITYLHHTHPDIPKYEPEAWTFLKGATATIDRNLGFGGKHLMHNIADFHVIHHLFSRIPQYYAEEATRAIQPLLGIDYHEDKTRSFWRCMWESFTKCQYVVPDNPSAKPEVRTMVYKSGPAPPIEISMGRGGMKAKGA